MSANDTIDVEKAFTKPMTKIAESGPSWSGSGSGEKSHTHVAFDKIIEEQDDHHHRFGPPMRMMTSMRGRDIERLKLRSFFERLYDRLRGENDSGGIQPPPAKAERLRIEFLHRYNILWARSKLFRHYESDHDLLEDVVAEQILNDLRAYSNALRDYRFFRTEGDFLFSTDDLMSGLAKDIVSLENARSKLPNLQEGSQEAQDLAEQIGRMTKGIGQELLKAMNETTSGITKDKEFKDRQALWARLLMALGGGLALIGPMLIMVLHPEKLTALITTSCCVVGVAVMLAIVMRDSQPKDIVAFTAAYAAGLVVFVGSGGGGSS
ncbi:hypothetical protein QBC43DRAFT_357478 [Cladorrhinum sp. PSN259]|nr:hypothetical protein QBC43DRAFT_357478 [Cladorrhinum sp. PSN259]